MLLVLLLIAIINVVVNVVTAIIVMMGLVGGQMEWYNGQKIELETNGSDSIDDIFVCFEHCVHSGGDSSGVAGFLKYGMDIHGTSWNPKSI